jgi:hypothetical protein
MSGVVYASDELLMHEICHIGESRRADGDDVALMLDMRLTGEGDAPIGLGAHLAQTAREWLAERVPSVRAATSDPAR